MTVQERLIAIAKSGWPIAYDGCHKMYFLQDKEREQEAAEMGYEIYPSNWLPHLWRGSCQLKFISRWGLLSLDPDKINADFRHELNIDQFEED